MELAVIEKMIPKLNILLIPLVETNNLIFQKYCNLYLVLLDLHNLN